MSNEAKAVFYAFCQLSRVDQLAVYEAIARKVTPADYGPLSDDDLTAIAAKSFTLLKKGRADFIRLPAANLDPVTLSA